MRSVSRRTINYLEFITPEAIAIAVLNQSFFEGAYVFRLANS
ncbi:hypothetical protein [Nostoc sp. 106C]|nr:hypothetical protein [Nostoc sp. 106C]